MQEPEPPAVSAEELAGWFAGRLPDGLFTGPPTIGFDRDELLVVGPIAPPEAPEGVTDGWQGPAELGRLERFREETRAARMQVADAAEARFLRKVAWGATCGGTTRVFTQLSLPIMTRLRFEDRAVLDTLVEANVARSRADALAWCVRLVAEHEADWIGRLRDALGSVDKVRAEGPGSKPQG